MALHFDDLDRRKLDETNSKVTLLVEQVARLQSRMDKVIRLKANHVWGRAYLRTIIKRLREERNGLRTYNRQLENELRLRGLE